MDLRGGAFTFPSAFPVISRADIENPKRLDASAVFGTVMISDSFIRHSGINGEECLAIILHEIGHLFQRSLDFFLSRVVTLVGHAGMKPLTAASNLIIQQGFTRVLLQIVSRPIAEFNAAISSLPIAKEFTTFINYLGQFIPPMAGASHLFNSFKNLPSVPIIMLASMYTGRAEIYADSFAVSYGYGPALGSGLDKLEIMPNKMTTKLAVSGSAINRFCHDYLQFTSAYLSWLLSLEPHPIAIVRILQTKEKLVRELAKQDLDPHTKRVILEDLRFVEAQIKKMSDSPEDRFNKTFQARYTINKAIVAGTHGKKSLLQFYKLEDVQD